MIEVALVTSYVMVEVNYREREVLGSEREAEEIVEREISDRCHRAGPEGVFSDEGDYPGTEVRGGRKGGGERCPGRVRHRAEGGVTVRVRV